jgi:Reverse transcriptase (RNA-dependent DNA polymerase)
MEQPPGFADPLYPNHVCKLNKALYGLKQAPRAWFSKLKNFLMAQQFISFQSNNSLFILKTSDVILYLLVYVDDLILIENSSSAIASFITTLASHFSIKDLGFLHYFLGIEVAQNGTALHLSQTRYL